TNGRRCVVAPRSTLAREWPTRLAGVDLGEDSSQDVDECAWLVALHRMPRVRDDVHPAESRRGAGEFVGVLVVDERRVRSAHQCGGCGERGHVFPQTFEAFAFADGIVTPGPGAVVEALRVVEYPTPQ